MTLAVADAAALAAHPGAPHAFVLAGTKGPLCAWYFAPAADVAPLGDVLVVPPFGEEMNRCRAMVALQARALARIGAGTLVLDPFGTGDSAGEFVDADWDIWRDDLLRGVAWLTRFGHGCCGLLGIRLGAIMAAELASQCPEIGHLIFWQPVLNGKTFQTQFLRIRVAAEMNRPDRIKSTNQLRALSAAGQPVEVSGYQLGPALALALDGLVLPEATLLPPVETDWFEIAADAAAAPPPATAKAVAALRQAGAALRFAQVSGPPFWQVHERELAPNLVSATAARVAAWGPAAAHQPPLHAGLARLLPADLSADLPADLSAEASARLPAGLPTALAETPLTLPCHDDHLCAVLHPAKSPGQRGAVIVVAGGPQYRAGAHRQFVSLARKLAENACAVLRFDLRGMGDSSGTYLGFEQSEPDIRAAIDAFIVQQPLLREIVLIGECESASGILFYAWRDPRVKGVVLVNPWVRTEEGRAQVIVNHYYLDRLRSPEFWALVRRRQFDVRASVKSMVSVLRAYVRGKYMFARASANHAPDDISGLPLPVKTAVGLSRYKGQVLLLMSGNDYIAREFDEVTSASRAWDGLLTDPRVLRRDIDGADHTFSKAVWKNAAAAAVVDWLRGW